MAINVSSSNLDREKEAALTNAEQHLKVFDRQVREYHGSAYREAQRDAGETSENSNHSRILNHGFAWQSHVLGQMVYESPAVRVGTKRPDEQGQGALLLHHGMNRWVKDHEFNVEFELCVRDAQFNMGVALVSHEPIPTLRPLEFYGGVDDQGAEIREEMLPWAPTFYRLSQKRFFWDPTALSLAECRFFGHIEIHDKNDLIAHAERHPEEGWNLELLRKLQTGNEDDTRYGRSTRNEQIDQPDRGEIYIVKMWVPGRQLEGKKRKDGFHGTWYTIPLHPVGVQERGEISKPDDPKTGVQPPDDPDGGKDPGYLRDPYAFYGPRQGPYVVGSCYTVPDDACGLGPLTATQELQDELNLVAAANTRSAKDWKRAYVVGGKDKGLAGKMKSNPHDYLFYSAGFDRGQVAEVQVGGIDPQGLVQEQRMKSFLDEYSGLADPQRGQVADGTATAVHHAIQQGNVRMSFIEKKMYRFAQRILEVVAWYMWHDNRVVMPLGPDAAEDLGSDFELVDIRPDGSPVYERQPIFYQGGFEEGDVGTSFEDLELTIEPHSMQRVDEGAEQANTMAAVQFVIQHAPMVRMFPELAWADIFESVGNVLNMPSMQSWINVEQSQYIGAAMMGMQAQQGMAPGGMGGGGQGGSDAAAPRFEGYSRAPGGNFGVGGAGQDATRDFMAGSGFGAGGAGAQPGMVTSAER